MSDNGSTHGHMAPVKIIVTPSISFSFLQNKYCAQVTDPVNVLGFEGTF